MRSLQKQTQQCDRDQPIINVVITFVIICCFCQEVMQEEVEAEAYSCQGQVARSLQDCQQV